MTSRPATRAQVARMAKVSESTVSYVLNGQRSISEKTKARVMAAVEELQYVPNYGAGLLAGRKSKTIGMLMPGKMGTLNPSSIEYLNGASIVCSENNYHLLIWSSEKMLMDEVVQFYRSGLISGIILMEIRLQDERVEILKKQKIPFVMIGRTEKLKDIEYVDRDFEGAAKLGIDELIRLGHQNIVMISNNRVSDKLKIGADIRLSRDILNYCKLKRIRLTELKSLNEPEAGMQVLKEIKEKHRETTAIISNNDQTVIGLVNSASQLGISIPNDLSVIALSNPVTQVEMTNPKLTMISPPSKEMGQVAMRALIGAIENKPIEITRLWRGELVVRGSTSRPRNRKLL